MDATVAATLGCVAGLAIFGFAVLAFRWSERTWRAPRQHPAPMVPSDVARVLSVLRSITIVVGPDDEVLQASASARALGLVKGARLVSEELLSLVRQVRRDGEIQQTDLELTFDRPGPIRTERGWGLSTGRPGREIASMAARVAPISSRLVLVLVEDRTKERRLDTIRRDFVANVSHELKTPVGALTLLAEAVQHAADDPEAVQRFAGRMQIESERLTRLVQQIIELSRVQSDDLLEEALPVDVDSVVEAALDRCRVDAQAKQIELVRAGETGLEVLGSEQQLSIALGNLVENAVGYSPERTRVVVDVRKADENLEIAVSDQGVGIAEEELVRVFERFYRVDRARSRDTGGTGLGLSIVKHVAAGHGGEVVVWSVPGEGSTFTLRLPLRGLADRAPAAPVAHRHDPEPPRAQLPAHQDAPRDDRRVEQAYRTAADMGGTT
ncbi:MAG TPA: ATP-binding protein [Actinopolymorphaceae bacterium]